MILSTIEIEKALDSDLNNWRFVDSKIERFISRDKDISLSTIVKKIWDYAEEVDHHPDILLTYSGIKITLFTHDEFGVTEKDISFANALNNIC
jgi:4a-hydroxytetrahydrobiopterin dehydratase